MKIAIMQPYFMPYIGYFQLINAVDDFVIYDNVEYTKKGWINRNRILINGEAKYITLSLERDSDFLNVNERRISRDFNKIKLLNKIKGAYIHAPYYNDIFPWIENIINYNEENLFYFILNSVSVICNLLNIKTKIHISSELNVNHNLRGKERVINICKEFNSDVYMNAIGGQKLYTKEYFQEKNIDLEFIQVKNLIYKQFEGDFVPNLSIIDVLMFNDLEAVESFLGRYKTI